MPHSDASDTWVDQDALDGAFALRAHPDGITGRTILVDAANVTQSPAYIGQATEATSEEQSTGLNAAATVPKKKKKSKSKSKSKKEAAKISGFEENYADAPMTPAEFEEEVNDVYHLSRSFTDRIETCIQRYRAKRRFSSERQHIFDKYLATGAITTGPKAFSGGLDHDYLEEKDRADITAMNATDHVMAYCVNAGKDGAEYVVDFEAIAKSFFSSRAPMYFDFATTDAIYRCTAVVRNLLNYILHHNVCPEYADQVNAARSVCDVAETELCHIAYLSSALPGEFNVACSTLYGGCYHGLYIGHQEWAKGMDPDLLVGLSDLRAKKIVMTGLSAHGSDAQVEHAASGIKVIRSKDAIFEITEIIPPTAETSKWYAEEVKESISVLGMVRARLWDNPYAAEEDGTDDEETGEQPREATTYEFWIEEALLEHFFVGMKVDATVRQLNCGVMYFDTVVNIYCSFLLHLEDDRLVGWKEHVPIKRGQKMAEEELAEGTPMMMEEQAEDGPDTAGTE